MEDGPDPAFIDSITPDVMKCLHRSGFFEKLDEILCPEDDLQSGEVCCGDYKLSESVLRASGFDASDLADIFDVLRSHGGFCDCEILYNVPEASRLKAKYWRKQAEDPKSRSKDVRHSLS